MRVPSLTLPLLSAILLLHAACTPSPRYTDSQQPSEAQSSGAQYKAGDDPAEGMVLTGFASFYGKKFAGRPTANGETFDPSEMTAAHKTLPFGTKLRVTLVSSGKSVVVRINDRGPFRKDRILDLSR